MVKFLRVPISLFESTTRALLATAVPAVKSSICSKSASLITALPTVSEPVIVGLAIVLLVNVSVVALPTSVSAEAGKVIVTSAVEAGPINVTALVPLSVSSLNKMLPAAEAEPDNTGAVNVLFVSVCVPVKVTPPALASTYALIDCCVAN